MAAFGLPHPGLEPVSIFIVECTQIIERTALQSIRSSICKQSKNNSAVFIFPDTVLFDNTYSYLRNKKLHYSIGMAPPLAGSVDETLINDNALQRAG